MKTVMLPYGRTELSLTVPDDRLGAVLSGSLNSYKSDKDENAILEDALSAPVSSRRLRDIAKDRKTAVIVTSDHTRPIPSRKTMPLLLRELRSGNPDIDITILIGTGLHRDTTSDEIKEHFGGEIFKNEKIVVHNCDDTDNLSEIGVSETGNSISINRLAVEADLLIAEGVIESHFFAGFSGGRKSILPGIAARHTVMANHCAENMASPNAAPGVMKDNPISDEMFFAAEKAGLEFIFNVILDSHKNIIGAVAGDPVKAHAEGVKFLSELCFTESAPADIVIGTNGGYPLDQNIYQCVKGMLSCSHTCREGGVIIMAAKCEDGHGGKGFINMFAETENSHELLKQILKRGRDETVPDQWQSQVFCGILEKHRVIMVTDAPEEQVRTFGMIPAKSPEDALNIAYGLLPGKDVKITVLPDAPSVIIKR